jgi:DNA-binding NarL/FixJ family response regulator
VIDAGLRVLLVSREPMFRLGLETLLARESMTVVSSVSTPTEALDVIATASPSLVLLARLLDRAPVKHSVRLLRAAGASVPILVVSSDAPAREIAAAVDAGASSWITALATGAEIAAAVRAVASGLIVVSRSLLPALVEPLAPRFRPRSIPAPPPAAQIAATTTRRRTPSDLLGDRERELLELLAAGRPSDEIAEAMGLSQETVKMATRALTQKLASSFSSPNGVRDASA